ncbi:ArsR/SmtB family transcription factor [Thermanaerovibrio acidaminovorans]|uniref:ArsR/SmtB family transcription factor n=1 Tax=Thermanaerovibrio acidaminovorans TaxID=81462 RepID=UPI001F5FB0EE|nr:metalloregulator ArsR/SmtB family transcription factor [Thermanaerovibrio acidaminovorans]
MMLDLIDGAVDSRVEMLKALAHPVRLRIVEVLGKGRLCVCQLAGMFPLDRTTVSKHLSVLKEAGVLEDCREGREIYYRLKIPCIGDFIACLDRMAAGGVCRCGSFGVKEDEA